LIHHSGRQNMHFVIRCRAKPSTLDAAFESILHSLRMGYFCCSRLISLQPINSPFGFRQYRQFTLHFAKSSN
jgi:hypothetical protein